MSPIPQVTPGVTRRLTKNSPPPRIGVGQKSSDIELTGSGRFSGAPQGASLDSLCATQMSMSVRGSPAERGLVEAMYRLSPSGDWIGQPSCTAEFNSALVPRTLSASTAVAHGENSSACADGAVNSATSASPTTTHVGENILLSFLWEVQVLAQERPRVGEVESLAVALGPAGRVASGHELFMASDDISTPSGCDRRVRPIEGEL